MPFKQTCFWLLAFASGFVWASPGAVDQYDCHRDPQTNLYHCHGSQDQSQQTHVLIGIANVTDIWIYDNGPSNVFSGGSAQLEYANKFIAGYGSYNYQVHVTGNIGYRISGWDLGLKLGPNISRLGIHPYVAAGVNGYRFTLPSETFATYGGFEYGGGVIWNFSGFAMDARVMYRDPSSLADVWTGWGLGGLTTNLASKIGVYARF